VVLVSHVLRIHGRVSILVKSHHGMVVVLISHVLINHGLTSAILIIAITYRSLRL